MKTRQITTNDVLRVGATMINVATGIHVQQRQVTVRRSRWFGTGRNGAEASTKEMLKR